MSGPNVPARADHYILWPCCPPTQPDVKGRPWSTEKITISREKGFDRPAPGGTPAHRRFSHRTIHRRAPPRCRENRLAGTCLARKAYMKGGCAASGRQREWSGRRDSNSRPPVPKTGALPDCATPRTMRPDKADSGGWKAKTARPTRPRKARRRGPDPRTGGAFPIPRRCRCAAQARH